MAGRIQPRTSDGQVRDAPDISLQPAWDVQPAQFTDSPFFRYTLLEALRVASVWPRGGTSSGATPVLPYARLAYTHTVAFLNKVWSFTGWFAV